MDLMEYNYHGFFHGRRALKENNKELKLKHTNTQNTLLWILKKKKDLQMPKFVTHN